MSCGPPARSGFGAAPGGEQYDPRTSALIERFAAVAAGALVWARDPDGLFRLGQLTGPWSYDADPAAVAADLVHVRSCDWSDRPWVEHEVPAAVLATFRRGGRNFQRIRAESAGRPPSGCGGRAEIACGSGRQIDAHAGGVRGLFRDVAAQQRRGHQRAHPGPRLRRSPASSNPTRRPMSTTTAKPAWTTMRASATPNCGRTAVSNCAQASTVAR